jgi:hypothetical protein
MRSTNGDVGSVKSEERRPSPMSYSLDSWVSTAGLLVPVLAQGAKILFAFNKLPRRVEHAAHD